MRNVKSFNEYYLQSVPLMEKVELSTMNPSNNINTTSVRIHDKNVEESLAVLREILKKEKSNIMSAKGWAMGRKNRQIEHLKIKLT